jgi:hypothetical protein
MPVVSGVPQGLKNYIFADDTAYPMLIPRVLVYLSPFVEWHSLGGFLLFDIRYLQIKQEETKSLTYKSMVRSNLEYCSSIWAPHTKQHIDKIESVQRRAAWGWCDLVILKELQFCGWYCIPHVDPQSASLFKSICRVTQSWWFSIVNLHTGKQTDLIILDFSKAFDKVPHKKLLRKLDNYGIRGNIKF